jgi:hypothetical protein
VVAINDITGARAAGVRDEIRRWPDSDASADEHQYYPQLNAASLGVIGLTECTFHGRGMQFAYEIAKWDCRILEADGR